MIKDSFRKNFELKIVNEWRIGNTLYFCSSVIFFFFILYESFEERPEWNIIILQKYLISIMFIVSANHVIFCYIKLFSYKWYFYSNKKYK